MCGTSLQLPITRFTVISEMLRTTETMRTLSPRPRRLWESCTSCVTDVTEGGGGLPAPRSGSCPLHPSDAQIAIAVSFNRSHAHIDPSSRHEDSKTKPSSPGLLPT